MAATTKLLHLRPPSHHLPTPSLLRFSSSSSDDPPPPKPKSSFSSYLNDVKGTLKSPPNATDPSSKISSLGQIHKNLSEFRRLSDPPPPSGPVSFQEPYNRNVAPEQEGQDKTKGLAFGSIRDSLKHLQPKNAGGGIRQGSDLGSFSSFNESLSSRLQMKKPEPVFRGSGSEALQLSGFLKKLDGEGGVGNGDEYKGEFFKSYTCENLGKKLMQLRPEKKSDQKNWFSLEELSERLHKVRAIDEKEMQANPRNSLIRQTLSKMVKSDMEKKTNMNVQRIDLLNSIGAEQAFMLSPVKEDLVENYFHPDHMSSAEKLKIELKKVRDEFKMSESDCGSARVQVAQLTTKIKHLSVALHKKDKHSWKGLQGMVQQRKKLLKYLRRTDWDSYCLVLSKLGLRDNPDYKN